MALEKRYNFSLDELDVVVNGYTHFRSFFTTQDGKLFAKQNSAICIFSFDPIYLQNTGMQSTETNQVLLEGRWIWQRFLSISENTRGVRIWKSGKSCTVQNRNCSSVENLSTLGRGESNLETRICSSQNIQKSRLMSSFFSLFSRLFRQYLCYYLQIRSAQHMIHWTTS